jgi:hypothetical protein
VTLTLNAAFDDIPEGSQQREDFKRNVLMDIAQSLGALARLRLLLHRSTCCNAF